MKISKILSVAVISASLAACGHTTGQRALSGGAIGAGAGALTTGVTGVDPVTGAIVGGLGGAAIGAATK